MALDTLNWKRFALTLVVVYLASFVITVILFGVILDPNGANLLERKMLDSARIIWIGSYMCLPLAFKAFATNHPIPFLMGIGYAAIAIVGVVGIGQRTGRAVLCVLLSIFTVLGTVQFFLMA